MRRVVVTGVGMVSPLGCGVEASWSNLIAGRTGVRRIESFPVDDLACQVAAQLPLGPRAEGRFDPDDWMEPKESRRVDPFIVYAMAAADQALADADWHPATDDDQVATGVLIGSGIGGLSGIEEAALTLHQRGPRRISPFFIPGRLINLAAGQVSIRHKLRGPNHAVVTACSTGAHAIGDAGRLISLGDADVMVAGGAESPVGRLAIAGFAACKALSTHFNDRPSMASRPYDRDRDGFVVGEGAGIVVLEERQHALARGAKIYGEVVGYGLSGDAYHITAPAVDGDGAERCIRMALKRAGVGPDEIELRAVERLVGNDAGRISMSSTKSATGHLLGAAGAVEAIFSLLAIRDDVVPPTLNLDNPSVVTAIDLVPHKARPKRVDVALSNSFGFGGTNASLVFRRHQ